MIAEKEGFNKPPPSIKHIAENNDERVCALASPFGKGCGLARVVKAPLCLGGSDLSKVEITRHGGHSRGADYRNASEGRCHR